MVSGRACAWLLPLALAGIAGTARADAPARDATAENHSACLAGFYDGSEPEIAAAIELKADGRFRYALSYGALDEQAEGRWENDGSAVYLTSDPVTPPRFAFLGERPASDGAFHVALDLPEGLSRQYFDARLAFTDGRMEEHQFGEDGLMLGLKPGDKPVSITVLLPLFELQSDSFALSGGTGSEVRLRFEPNDLGKVSFDHTPLRRETAALTVQRHDRLIRFRPKQGGCRGPQEP